MLQMCQKNDRKYDLLNSQTLKRLLNARLGVQGMKSTTKITFNSKTNSLKRKEYQKLIKWENVYFSRKSTLSN